MIIHLFVRFQDHQKLTGQFFDQIRNRQHQVIMSSPILDRFSILSWNIGGLHEQDLEDRYHEVARIIEAKKFAIVFLQEVIPEALEYFKKTLDSYTIIGAQDKQEPTKSLNNVSLVTFTIIKGPYISIYNWIFRIFFQL